MSRRSFALSGFVDITLPDTFLDVDARADDDAAAGADADAAAGAAGAAGVAFDDFFLPFLFSASPRVPLPLSSSPPLLLPGVDTLWMLS